MKKIVIFLVLSVMAVSASAQGFYWGVKGGLNLSDVTNSGGSMKPSIYVGAFGEYQFTDKWAIQPELVYSRQGFNFKDGEGTDKYRMNYLNVPIMGKWYAIPQKLSIELGPQIGFALKYAIKDKEDGETRTRKVDNNFYDAVDIGIGVGLSYYLTYNIGVSARYNFGFTDTWKNIGVSGTNQVIQLGAFFRF